MKSFPTSFADLTIGETFEFDHTALSCNCGSLAHGPWIKTSARKYTTQDRSIVHKVGSIRAIVRCGDSCGHPYWDRITRIAAAMEKL